MNEAISKAMAILAGGNRTARHTTYSDAEINEVIGILRSLRDNQEEKPKKVYTCNIADRNGGMIGQAIEEAESWKEAAANMGKRCDKFSDATMVDFRRVE